MVTCCLGSGIPLEDRAVAPSRRRESVGRTARLLPQQNTRKQRERDILIENVCRALFDSPAALFNPSRSSSVSKTWDVFGSGHFSRLL